MNRTKFPVLSLNHSNLCVTVAALILAALLSSCITRQTAESLPVSMPDTPFTYEIPCEDIEAARPHTLYIDPAGEFIDYQGDNCPHEELYTRAEHIEAIKTSLLAFSDQCNAQGKHCEVVVFVHGGLNSANDTAVRIVGMLKPMLNDGYYPILISWRSSFVSTYRDHLFKIRQGRESSIAKATSIPYFVADLAQVVANSPVALLSELANSIESVSNDMPDAAKLASYNVTMNQDSDTGGKPIRAAGWWLTSPFKLIATPFVHTLGRSPWVVMNRRTLTTLYSEEVLDSGTPIELVPILLRAFGRDNPALEDSVLEGTAFDLLAMLRELQETNALGNTELSLFGHSMGAIVANHFLIAAPTLEWDRIVHMASADSIANFYVKVIPYLREHEKTNFYGLHLDWDNENREVNMYGVVPSGSLLVWIDNMYTSPATMVDRTAGRFTNFWPVYSLSYPELTDTGLQNRIKMIIFEQKANNGDCEELKLEPNPGCVPQKHGHFSKAEFWKPQFYDSDSRRRMLSASN